MKTKSVKPTLKTETKRRKFSRRRSGKQDGPKKASLDLLWETMDKNSSFELELLCWQMLSVKGQITIIFGFAGHMSLSHRLLCIFYLLKCKKFC